MLLHRTRKGTYGYFVNPLMRYLLIIAVLAVLVWLGSLLWQMLQSTGNTF
jgi:hypothetical protein